ncbi:MAG TPA: MerR family transcriptional regulator [Thermomicrobiales bacterium]|nr:MerR family transcriptional regulator [Thermomicrobiales bacterium]
MDHRYRVGEFASLTGVSVRTLHHYDRIGLLRPEGYSEGGHRLYGASALLRLQQILTLRYLGFGLKQIANLLERPDFNLVASMRIQQRELRNRISELERIEETLKTMLDHHRTTGNWSWEMMVNASAALGESLATKGDNMSERFSPELMKQFDELGQQLGQEAIKEIEDEWTALIADVRANRGLDPASAEARALADRWNTLNDRLADAYKDYPELWQAIGDNYQENAYADVPEAPQPEDFAFIQRINEARARSSA